MSHGSVSAKGVARKVLPLLESYLLDLDTRAHAFEAAEHPAVRAELPDAVMLDSPDTAKIEEVRVTIAWLKELVG